jgi:glutamyl-tRNA synthetase
MIQRGRFAPSPTGELHLGNARTALLAWLWARSAEGELALRIEDLDGPRVRPGMAERQMEDLRWLGLDWDGDAVFQSGRTSRYDEAVQRLTAAGHVYECFCSRAGIAAVASAPQGDEGPRYPGTCATLDAGERERRRLERSPALRLRVPAGRVEFDDEIAGAQSFDTQAMVGDFVLRRADGVFAYQLAVVVDDGAMRITQVLRGADLLASTARQILLHRMLGQREPRWAHAPMIVAPGGRRLAKRDRALTLSHLRASGADPRRIVGRLARSSGLQAPEACIPAQLIRGFSMAGIERAATEIPEDAY